MMNIGLFNPSSRRWLPELAVGPDPTELLPPMVLVSVHVGPIAAAAALMEILPAEVLVFADGLFPNARPGSVVSATDEWQRAALTRRAIQTLRSGGFVFMAVDGRGSARVETTMSGERVSWARAPFDLARLTASPMRPMMMSWREAKIVIHLGDPIRPGDATAMADQLAQWLTRYLRGTATG